MMRAMQLLLVTASPSCWNVRIHVRPLGEQAKICLKVRYAICKLSSMYSVALTADEVHMLDRL
jgi:hypothetical protein